jgi:ADP-heptose:LPS heptosyltransferase
MDKAFFLNGGAGRILTAIPALEKNIQKNPNNIVIAEAWPELYLMSPILRDCSYVPNTKNLFEDKLLARECVTPEPYRLNAYYNQKCNLSQAFDMIINELDEIPDIEPLNLEISKRDQVFGYNFIDDAKTNLRKDKCIVFQPFGSAATIEGRFIIDSTGRSFELADALHMIEQLKEEYVIIMMSTFPIPTNQDLGILQPKDLNLIQWAGIINAADGFLGCDSIGQHMAHALDKPATVVIGGTAPENISYPHNKDFKIFDLGVGKRKFAPMRVTFDPTYDLNNEGLMLMDDKTKKEILDVVKGY